MPSQAVVMELSHMFYFEQMSSTVSMIWYIPESLLLYSSWSSLLPGVVLAAVIMCTLLLPPSITRAEVLHLSLKDPSLTAMSVPFLIPCYMCR